MGRASVVLGVRAGEGRRGGWVRAGRGRAGLLVVSEQRLPGDGGPCARNAHRLGAEKTLTLMD